MKIKAGFGYDNSVSLQTDDAGYVGAAVLAHVVCIVGLQTNDVPFVITERGFNTPESSVLTLAGSNLLQGMAKRSELFAKAQSQGGKVAD